MPYDKEDIAFKSHKKAQIALENQKMCTVVNSKG